MDSLSLLLVCLIFVEDLFFDLGGLSLLESGSQTPIYLWR